MFDLLKNVGCEVIVIYLVKVTVPESGCHGLPESRLAGVGDVELIDFEVNLCEVDISLCSRCFYTTQGSNE
jgi:hypothetical protein